MIDFLAVSIDVMRHKNDALERLICVFCAILFDHSDNKPSIKAVETFRVA
jgi:hypothetical protein